MFFIQSHFFKTKDKDLDDVLAKDIIIYYVLVHTVDHSFEKRMITIYL